jgi:hypothetical protein
MPSLRFLELAQLSQIRSDQSNHINLFQCEFPHTSAMGVLGVKAVATARVSQSFPSMHQHIAPSLQEAL